MGHPVVQGSPAGTGELESPSQGSLPPPATLRLCAVLQPTTPAPISFCLPGAQLRDNHGSQAAPPLPVVSNLSTPDSALFPGWGDPGAHENPTLEML